MNNEILKKTYGKQIIQPVKVSGKEIAKKRLKMYIAKKKYWQKAKKIMKSKFKQGGVL